MGAALTEFEGATNLVVALLGQRHDLVLAGTGLSDSGAAILAQACGLVRLSLPYNQIGPEGTSALALNTGISVLDLSGNQVGDEGARALAASKYLTTLILDFSGIGADGARALAENDSINVLSLAGNDIGEEGLVALANMQTRRPSVQINGINLSEDRVAAAKASLREKK